MVKSRIQYENTVRKEKQGKRFALQAGWMGGTQGFSAQAAAQSLRGYKQRKTGVSQSASK